MAWGKSGLAAALFLRHKGAQVTVSDIRSAESLAKEIPALLDEGIMVGWDGCRIVADAITLCQVWRLVTSMMVAGATEPDPSALQLVHRMANKNTNNPKIGVIFSVDFLS